MADLSLELEALGRMVESFEAFDTDTRARVLRYLVDRYTPAGARRCDFCHSPRLAWGATGEQERKERPPHG